MEPPWKSNSGTASESSANPSWSDLDLGCSQRGGDDPVELGSCNSSTNVN